MKLLDLFCGAGGAATGYAQAGFEVTGVDIVPQPLYPFDFVQHDAVTVDLDGFDAIHASPPCQEHIAMTSRYGAGDARMIQRIRGRLQSAGVPYVIENVTGARKHLQSPLMLHGAMFDLPLYRPRLFETNVLLWSPPPTKRHPDAIVAYGERPDGRIVAHRRDGTYLRQATLQEARKAMKMPWADWRGLCEAIPPAYTEWLGTQLAEHVTGSRQDTARTPTPSDPRS